jgi:hypothetical protein
MKKRFDSSRRGEAPKKARKSARKCPCCGATPCSCEKTCFCQELKGELEEDDDADAASFDDDLQFSFLRFAEPGV